MRSFFSLASFCTLFGCGYTDRLDQLRNCFTLYLTIWNEPNSCKLQHIIADLTSFWKFHLGKDAHNNNHVSLTQRTKTLKFLVKFALVNCSKSTKLRIGKVAAASYSLEEHWLLVPKAASTMQSIATCNSHRSLVNVIVVANMRLTIRVSSLPKLGNPLSKYLNLTRTVKPNLYQYAPGFDWQQMLFSRALSHQLTSLNKRFNN